jgi:ribosome-associated protein YbcJ (S4-like RNA binding protein)
MTTTTAQAENVIAQALLILVNRGREIRRRKELADGGHNTPEQEPVKEEQAHEQPNDAN